MSKQKKINSSFISTTANLLLDCLFPRRCFGCGSYETFLCDECLIRIPRRTPATFFVTPSSALNSSLDSLTSASFFHVPIVSLLIHNFKYSSLRELSLPLSKLLIHAAEHTSVPLPDIITAVPLHSKRLRERGFNQSEELANELTQFVNSLLPLTTYYPLLQKTRSTKPQSKQHNRQARLSNLIDVFDCHPAYLSVIQDKTIWLIDDVTTTGSTLNACAKVLKKYGAKTVHGFVIAH